MEANDPRNDPRNRGSAHGGDPRNQGGRPRDGGGGDARNQAAHKTRKLKTKSKWWAEILLVVPEGFCKIYRSDYELPKSDYKGRAVWALIQVPLLLVSLEGLYLTTMNVTDINTRTNEATSFISPEIRFLPKFWGNDGAKIRRLAPNGQLKGALGKFRDLNFATDLVGAAIDVIPVVNTITRVDPDYVGETIFDHWDRFAIAFIASVAIQRIQGLFIRKMSRDILAKRVNAYNSATKLVAKDDAIWAAKPAAISHNSYGIGEFILPIIVVGLAYSVEIATSLAMVRGMSLSSLGKLVLVLGNCLGFEISERIREETTRDFQ